ncbi:MAG: nitrile hydratase accessory protein [Pseudomonadota bacterium]
MSRPDDQPVTPLRRLDGDPVFDEPWQAQVLALADTLISQGTLSPSEWSLALGSRLEQAAQAGEPDTPETYYRCALHALEQLLSDGAQVSAEEVSTRSKAWEEAYLATPHGKPVVLESQHALEAVSGDTD